MKNDVVRWSTQKRRKTYSKLCCNQENKKFPAYCAGEISYNTTFLGSSYASAEDVNKYGSTNYPERRNWHNYLNEYRHESRRHSSNRKCRSSYWSTLIFEIGIAIFLCSFQVSLVSCSEFESGSVIDDRSLLHELDYADKESSFENHYTHTWAVHIPDGDMDSKADAVAHDNGFVNMGKIFQDHYLFAHHKVAKRSVEPSTNHQSRLDEDGRVTWSKQQIAKSRRKRDFIRMRPSRTSSRSASSRVKAMPFTDPKWEHMWYLNRGGDLDMNVIPAWKEGITGKGIVVTILDDGLESDHPDIINNYDPKASYDVNSHDEDPMPHYDLADSNRHGTRCAGEVAATANNSICAVGIAFGASVGGVRMLDGDVTDAVEARSLSLNPQHIDIYSASWGPDDDGKTVDGPGELASRAFIEGVTKGRAGKGSIFIWASGNGGREMDNCNCDGYTNSIWTLSISSATEDGFVPWYSEKCSSTLATTYSSGSQAEKQVVTTDLHHSCTVSHTGTSASAPLAAGIAALVLESNNNLTWRDMQHIVVRTAKPANLMDPTWSKNGVGRRVSHSFGYGLMDAAAMVKLARQWKTVPEQQRCEINAPHVDKVIPPKSHITLQLSVKNCLNINFLEHVQAKITLTSQRRGDIQINLISPAGTKVTLLTPRVHDTSHSGFNQWPFMSVHTWGESPHGNWQLEIHNEGRYMGHALLREWSLIFYGTTQSIDPNDPVSTPRTNFDITTPNSSSTTTSLYQIYSAQYPRIPSTNFISSKLGAGGKFSLNKLTANPSNIVNNFALPNATLSHVVPNKKFTMKQGSSSQNNKNSKQNKNFKARPQDNAKFNKNNKVKSKESSSTSTPTPKNKFYRISQQGKISSSKSTSSSENLKSKTGKTQHSSERLQASIDHKSNKKVVGDLPITNSKKVVTYGSGESNAKLHVKATKQVKNLLSTRIPTTTTELSATNRIQTSSVQSNQRITKLFERYEKIQSIFPEFQPYQPVLKDQKENITKIEIEKSLKTNHSMSLPFNVSTNPSGSFTKPSRENTRKLSSSFVPDQNILKKQQLLLAAAGVSGGTQRPISGTLTSSQKKIFNAQITQWDLIFYGTEEPAQPDDPVPMATDKFNLVTAEAERNNFDYGSNSQWRDTPKLGESGMENHDRTNTSCLKATINLQCLVCAPPTFFYRGRCYDMCPAHTYIARGQLHVDMTYNNLRGQAPDYEELQANDRKKRSRGAEVGETDDDGHTLNSQTAFICEPCDKSCFNCFGPLSSECKTCYSGSQLKRRLNTNESYCVNFSERSSGNAIASQRSDRDYRSLLFLVFLVPSVIIILVVLLNKSEIRFNICKCQRKAGIESSVDYRYDRVSLIADEEAQEELD
ncbi:furin-like protease 1 isoform X2 [Musca domestica]|uniref:Furin-like protease 1 isoform X2 n=1 Tax=Musca domestica TaxID=7370 RepID=A0ABM3VIM7_MUSDO|nr:furin-like protease 1 isoform X2 [Musca domestica]